MSESVGAVFLSYASQDADAAARIGAALGAAGIEVWFDRSELRGGDAWDQQIRRQIRGHAPHREQQRLVVLDFVGQLDAHVEPIRRLVALQQLRHIPEHVVQRGQEFATEAPP